MAENLKLFNEHSEYEDFIQTDDFTRPNVSYCIQEDEVHYSQVIPVPGMARLYNGSTLLEEKEIYFEGTEGGFLYPIGYSECYSNYGSACHINLGSCTGALYDSFELDLDMSKLSNITVSGEGNQFTYTISGNTLKVTSTEGSWQYLHSFSVIYTYKGTSYMSSIVIDYCD